MASQINDEIDTSLPAETSGVNIGKILKSTFTSALGGLKAGLTTAKSEITALQDSLAGKAASGHTHNITEEVQDIVAAMLVAGTNISFTYNDATGQIVVNSTGVGISAPQVSSVSSVSATEGGILLHVVTLSALTSTISSYPFAISSGTALIGTDTFASYIFSDGVTLSGSNLIVPAGVSTFTIRVDSVDDSFVEANETYTISVGGISGTGTINNNDTSSSVSVAAISASSATEGDMLSHTVILSATTTTNTSYAFSLTDVETSGFADYGNIMLSNGVTLVGNTINVPAGVASFTVSLSAINDVLTSEATETYLISIGEASAIGTILNNSGTGGTISTPTISKSGVFTTITFTTSNSLRGGVEFGLTTSYGYAVVENYGTATTMHTIILESNANPLLSPHGLQTGLTYNLRAVAGVGGVLVSSNITFVA